MPAKKKLIVIGGPTASGKTALGIDLAQQFDTEIISADSRQFYQEMNIGTAKPTKEELNAVTHHFIGHLSILDGYSAGQFEREALEKINALFKEKDWVVLVGGSGLFIKAITEGFDEFPDIPEAVRENLNEQLATKGLAHLQKELAAVDPAYYAQLDQDNPRRIIRALEVIHTTGKPFSEYRQGQQIPRDFECIFLQPHWDRKALYARINQRVEMMFADGLEEEARALYPKQALQSLQTVGYQELFDFFEGKISIARAQELIQQNSRRYAKRQLTWARQTGQWFLLEAPFAKNALSFIRAQTDSWQWNIEHQLSPTSRVLIAEEKISRISWNQGSHQGYFILAKQPRFSQAIIWFSKDYPTDKQELLLQQLFLRTVGFPLFFWSNYAIHHLEQQQLQEIDAGGNFPFADWVEKSDNLVKYKRNA